MMPEASDLSFISRSRRLLFGVEFDAPIGRSGDRMIRHTERQFRVMHLETAVGDPRQAAAAFEIMKKMSVNREQRNAAAEFGHHMRRPDLLEKRAWMCLQEFFFPG